MLLDVSEISIALVQGTVGKNFVIRAAVNPKSMLLSTKLKNSNISKNRLSNFLDILFKNLGNIRFLHLLMKVLIVITSFISYCARRISRPSQHYSRKKSPNFGRQ